MAPGFLVAAPILRDPNFAGSVVLMVEHSDQGAVGFVVNRVASANLRRILTRLGIKDTPVRCEVPVMLGGPCSQRDGWIVFEAKKLREQREDVLMVTESLGVSASKQFLIDAIKGDATERAMLVHGFAGWGPGQLESEIRQGAWIPVDLDARVIFDTAPDVRWTAALSVLGIHPASLPRTQIALA